eukprot:314718_1
MSRSATKWNQLCNPPFHNYVANMFVLNENELLIVPEHVNDSDQYFSTSVSELWKYNIDNDTYSNVVASTNVKNRWYSASLNDDKSLLYLFGESGHIIQINLKTKKVTISNRKFHDGTHSQTLFINGKFHIFGGWKIENKSHFIWDENKQNLIEIYKFETMEPVNR